LLAEGHIQREDIAREVDAFVTAWLAEQEGATGAAPTTTDEEVAAKLREILMAMLTATSQPAPGDRAPCAEDVLACLKRGDVGA
jgi:hypothetical protein